MTGNPHFPVWLKLFTVRNLHIVKKNTQHKKERKNRRPLLLTNPREKARVQHGIKGVCGAVYEQLDFHAIIHDTNKNQQCNEILKYCVLSRVAHPDSKRKTVEILKEDYNETVPLEKMYHNDGQALSLHTKSKGPGG